MKTEWFTSQSIPSQHPEITHNLWKAHAAIQGMLTQTDSVASWTPSSDVKKSWVIFGTFSQICFNSKYGTRQLRPDRELSWPHWPIFTQAVSARLVENSINSSRQVPIINMGNLEVRFQSLKFLLSENTSGFDLSMQPTSKNVAHIFCTYPKKFIFHTLLHAICWKLKEWRI